MTPLPPTPKHKPLGESVSPVNRTWASKTELSGLKCQLPRMLERANPNSSLGFCKPPSPARAELLSRLNSLTFTQHSINVIVSGLLTDFDLETELLSF